MPKGIGRVASTASTGRLPYSVGAYSVPAVHGSGVTRFGHCVLGSAAKGRVACRPLPPVRKSRVEHAASGTQSTPTDISDPRWIAATRRVSDAPTARAQLRVVRGPCSSGELRESQARRRPTHPISAGLLEADLDRQSKAVVTAWNYTRTVSERGSWTLPPPPIYCCEEMIGRDCRVAAMGRA